MKVLKIVFIAVIAIFLINIFQPEVSAVEIRSFDEMKTAINQFMNTGKNGNSANISGNDMGSIIIPVANILTAIGVVVLVAVTIVMGIKYMFATPEEADNFDEEIDGIRGARWNKRSYKKRTKNVDGYWSDSANASFRH